MQGLLILVCFIGVIEGGTFTALRFSASYADFITFTPNLENSTSEFSVCMWAKRISPGSAGMALSYTTRSDDDIYIGPFNHQHVLGDSSLDGQLAAAFTAETGVWVHTCTTYNSATKRSCVYFNGELGAVDIRASSTKLSPGGDIMLGNHVSRRSNSYNFGSHMYDLNMYSRELEDDEVKAMYDAGMCSTAALRDDSDRAIKWEAVLDLTRNGDIREQDVDYCYTLLDQQGEIAELRSRANQSECGVKLGASENRVTSLRDKISSLGSQISALRQKRDNATIWDVVRSEGIVNQILTPQHLADLTGGYAYLERLVGVNITEPVIELLKLVTTPHCE